MVIVLNDYYGVLVRVCIWILGFYKLKALGTLMDFRKFSLWIVANLLCSCPCLFDTIIELHTMNEEKFFNFLWKQK